ncbi:hypothetical protein TNCV_730011 [Trichonephila clavipes]|nr:hypothetical protein TNCV_730011 [Trichonephila clavipes]
MGNLPKHRVTLERPFFSCDIDYAGPVLIKCKQSSRGASFKLQPQRSLGVATEHQTGAFWKKWSSEFISSLQPRKKWQDAQPNLKEDDIVLIKEEGPPGTWPMARVLSSASRQRRTGSCCNCETQDSVFKRPVHKLHKLPIYPN